MEILEVIKRIKEIKPDADYTQKSKLVVLASPQFDKTPSVFKLWLVSGARYGSALILASVVIILVLGGFSIKRSGDDLVTGLDIGSLRAEAEAIGIQIRLNSLGYEEVSKVISEDAEISLEDGGGLNDLIGNNPKIIGDEIVSVGVEKAEDSTSTTTLNIEDVLERLAK